MLLKCHACDLRARDCRGACPCSVDGRDIIAHADAGYCPHPSGPKFGNGKRPDGWNDIPVVEAGKYTPPIPPPPLSTDAQQLTDAHQRGLGDDVERLAKALGADKLAKVYEELTGWSCGCEARKELLNRLPSLASMWGWAIGKPKS